MTSRKLMAMALIALGITLLAGCNSMAELERESSIFIEIVQQSGGQEGLGGTGVSGVKDQEGIGGSGRDDPDGIGGTGIIGLVSINGTLSVGGIAIPSLTGAELYANGEIATVAAISSGQLAAVQVDSASMVRQIHVFDQNLVPPAFLGQVSQLIIRGELVTRPGGDTFIHGISVPTIAVAGVGVGDSVQIQATASNRGQFRIDRVGPITIQKPTANPEVTQPQPIGLPLSPNTGGKPSAESPEIKPVEPQKVTPPQRPEPLNIPVRPEPVELPRSADPVRLPPTPIAVPVPTKSVDASPLGIDQPAVVSQPVVAEPKVVEPPVIAPAPIKINSPADDIMRPTDVTAQPARP